MNSRSFLFLAFLFFTGIDQILKYFIRQSGGFYICNPGIAWGIKIPEPAIMVGHIFLIAVLFFLIFLRGKRMSAYLSAAITLILAGGSSNLVDRIAFGCVIDFINFGFWPVFNLGDASIACGGILLLVRYLKK